MIVMCSSCLFDCLCMGVCFVGIVELRRRREEREAIAKEREAWYFAVGRGGTEMISFVELQSSRLQLCIFHCNVFRLRKLEKIRKWKLYGSKSVWLSRTVEGIEMAHFMGHG